tara:strand:- start:25 stop:537 length:513 start_codon:yes stop_codon:yes gene_type:complete
VLKIFKIYTFLNNGTSFIKKNDLVMFYKYLEQSTVYFEFGSGGSTYQASIRKCIQKLYSVESDKKWQQKLKKIVVHPNITYLFNEMKTPPKSWGRPGKHATEVQKRRYSNHIQELSKEEQNDIDFVFIDGRFRVSCCLKCYDIDNCLIAFDDFLDRPHYHIVLILAHTFQ